MLRLTAQLTLDEGGGPSRRRPFLAVPVFVAQRFSSKYRVHNSSEQWPWATRRALPEEQIRHGASSTFLATLPG